MLVLRKIDQLTQGDHFYIDKSSDCYYFAEYPSGDNPENKSNPIYSLIHNIKKPMNRQSLPEWQYKRRDLANCSETLKKLFQKSDDIGEFTLIPMPPSKTKMDPAYDPRIIQILEGLKSNFEDCDVRELLYTLNNMQSSHESNIRPSIEAIVQNFGIDSQLLIGCRPKVIIFDDVLTTGAHFCAAKRKILEVMPSAKIIGYFIARRVLPQIDDFKDDWLKEI